MARKATLMLALIPARGGSKGLPGKNIRDFAGRPLIAHSILQALECPAITRVVVSTDSEEIALRAREAGAEVPFLRPSHLAGDATSSLDVFLHAMGQLHSQELVVLQPTSPLRTSAQIEAAIALYQAQEAESLVSCVEAHPLTWNLRQTAEGFLQRAVESPAASRRQEAERVLVPNGSIFIVREGSLRLHGGYLGERCAAYLMAACSSIDIDTIEDFKLAELIYKSGLHLETSSEEVPQADSLAG